MDMQLKSAFLEMWQKYFNGVELPITFYYTDRPAEGMIVKPGSVSRCIIGALEKVRKGESMAFDVDAVGCPGGRKYTGFTHDVMKDFEYFLSCGIEGKLEGERYKKSPELVRHAVNDWPKFDAPARYIVFKRWDNLEETDTPDVAVFFAQPDVLSGLFTLASFEEAHSEMTMAPFGSGCASIIQYPFLESRSEHPRTVIGMFDVSARPFVPADRLSFSVPVSKLSRMVADAEESFLITSSWQAVQKRIK